MKIAVIGAGFTGLSTAYQLTKKGHEVTVFEKDSKPGGLAIGYQEKGWEWTLEEHYHHWFTNDKFILNLAQEINHKVLIRRPKTSVLVDNHIYRFDSPKDILLFPRLSLIDRVRMGAVAGVLRYDPYWKPLEKINASTFLPKTMGKKAYQMIWEPLFHNKFGEYASDVSLAWFWSRIAKRTPSLAYPESGFLEFALHLTKAIEKQGGIILFNTELKEINPNKKVKLTLKDQYKKTLDYEFDNVIVTLPTSLFIKTAPKLPDSYKTKYTKLRGIGATNLVLRLKEPFFKDQTYWLNVCDKNNPIMAIVEHTNLMDKKHYNNEHILYLGNYLPTNHPQYLMDKKEKLAFFDPYLRKINSDYKKCLIGYELFKAPFAQPIIPTNYSKLIPPMTTPMKNVYLANIDQVYPWDRGTNYAVEMGEKVAGLIENYA